ncbi:unnamed protein product [Ambrosiozyma monospora]|uniref:Unnamed protein product n=1 Tax=Ambrosiozyma monospora TaxID=43982 RepID=A0ACB5U1H8_AMBMO|nr:unnamed protein product [Ambrosiozyma monospora]
MTKRTSLFYVSSCLAGIISGPLQEWLLQEFRRNNDTGMGWGGLEPFKCMFVVDAIISCPIGLYTLLVNPNTPTTTDAWYFSDQDKLVALERYKRMQREASERGDTNGSSTSTKSLGYRDLFKSWHIFVFPLMFLCFHHSGWAIGQPTFQTWMKYDLKLPSSKYNFFPAVMSGINMVVSVLCSFANDYFGNGQTNHYFILGCFTIFGTASTLLYIWEIPTWLHWCAYFMIGCTHSTPPPLIFSWLNRLLANDEYKRGSLIFATNTVAYFTSSWLQILVWNAADAPRYHTGFLFTIIICILGFGFTSAATYFTYHDHQKSHQHDPEDEDSLPLLATND